MDRVWIVNRPCEDSTYPGHVDMVFASEAAANACCAELNKNVPDWDVDSKHYVTEHVVY